MSRLDRARRLGARVDARWRREDVEAQLAGLHARQRTWARRKLIAAPLAGLLVAAGLYAVIVGLQRAPVAVVASAPPIATVHEAAPAPAIAPPVERVAEPPARRAGPASELRAVAVAPRESPARVEPVPAPSTWRDDARRDDYAAAWRGLVRAAPLETMADLLLAGDVARLSGHADAAVGQLGRAVALHPEDPRSPLAAFTLGRVHLEDLGAPREAAEAFARARALAPGGPLAEDALAREVEAWSRAGEAEVARARAKLYLQRYPQGHRARAVRRFGGLEAP